jgi:hypothetical protein
VSHHLFTFGWKEILFLEAGTKDSQFIGGRGRLYLVALFRKLAMWNRTSRKNEASKLTECYMQEGQSGDQADFFTSIF